MRGIAGLLTIMLFGGAQAAESFLTAEELATLKPHPQVEGVIRYVTPGVTLGDYTKVIVGSVTFYFSEKSKSKDIDADTLKEISDAMKSAIYIAAGDNAEVVLTKGPGAVLINIAITEINMQNKKRGLLGYTPIGLIATGAANLAGVRMRLKDAKLEGEVVDSVTGDVVAIFRVDDIVDWDDEKGLSWEDVRATFEVLAARAMAAARISVP